MTNPNTSSWFVFTFWVLIFEYCLPFRSFIFADLILIYLLLKSTVLTRKAVQIIVKIEPIALKTDLIR